MAYTPINWQNGDTITAEKMNKMDNGWGVGSTQLFSETVTTAGTSGFYNARLAYLDTIDYDTIVVNFNGTDYTCPRIDAFDGHYYGGIGETGPDFSEFPFAIENVGSVNTIYTQLAGEYTVAVSVEGVQTSSNFSEAVNQCVDTSAMPMLCVNGVTTTAQATTAKNNGKLLYFWTESSGCFFINDIGNPCAIYPESENVRAYFDRDSGIFNVTEA